MKAFAFPMLLLAFVALAASYSVIVPLGEAPDEVSHFAYLRVVAEDWQLPEPAGAVYGEAHQPPLYYFTIALFTFWIPRAELPILANPDFALDDPQAPNLLLHPSREDFPYSGTVLMWHLARALSVGMGALTVWTTRQIARALGTDEWVALGTAGFVAFLPGFLQISAAVNNDNLIVLLSALSVWQTIRALRAPLQARESARLGIFLGLAALTKLSGLTLWIFVGLCALIYGRGSGWKTLFRHAAICYGIALMLVAPWMLNNFARHGDPLGWALVLKVTPLRTSPMTLDEFITTLIGLYTSFWGRMGGALHIHLPDVLYLVLGGAMLVAPWGWIVYARRAESRNEDANRLAILFGLFWAIMLAAFARWTLTALGTDQARQLFPGLPLLAIFFVTGLSRALTAPARVAVALTAAQFALGVGVGFYLATLYAIPARDPATLTRFGAADAPIDFGNKIRVLDYLVTPTQLKPGDAITVQVNAQALRDPEANYWFLFQLVGAPGTVTTRDGVPSAGRATTDRWRAGQYFFSRHRISVPPDAEPGTYALTIGLHPFDKWDWLPVRGGDTFTLGRINVVSP